MAIAAKGIIFPPDVEYLKFTHASDCTDISKIFKGKQKGLSNSFYFQLDYLHYLQLHGRICTFVSIMTG